MVLSKDLSESLLRACLTGNLSGLKKAWKRALKLISEQDLCRVSDKSNGDTLLRTALIGFQRRNPTACPDDWLNVVKFLLDHGVSANELHGFRNGPVTTINSSALMTACEWTYPHYSDTWKMVSLLLSRGADPLYTDSDDMTAMLVASGADNLKVIRVLLTEGKVAFCKNAEHLLRMRRREKMAFKTSWGMSSAQDISDCTAASDQLVKEFRSLQNVSE